MKMVISNFPKQKQALDTKDCYLNQIFKEQYSLPTVCLARGHVRCDHVYSRSLFREMEQVKTAQHDTNI